MNHPKCPHCSTIEYPLEYEDWLNEALIDEEHESSHICARCGGEYSVEAELTLYLRVRKGRSAAEVQADAERQRIAELEAGEKEALRQYRAELEAAGQNCLFT